MAQTSYLIKPGTTAEDLAQQREYAQMLLRGAADTSPKGHWAHIPAQALLGALGGWEGGEVAAEGRRTSDEAAGLISSLAGGGEDAQPAAVPSIGATAPGVPTPARGMAAAAGREADYGAANPDLYGMIRKEEGFAPVAKWDVRQNSGGYGSRAAPGERFDQAKAEQYLRRDAAPVEAWINANAPGASVQQKQALLSFGYNLGVDDLEKLKPDIQAGDWARVGQRMLSFNKAAVGPGGALVPLEGLINRRQREAGMIAGGGASIGADRPAAASIGAAAPPAQGANVIGQLWRNPQTRPIAQAILTAKMGKEKKRHVVAPGASLTDDSGNVLYRAPAEDATAKARQAAIGKGQGEATLALPAAVARAEETVGILDKLRNHKGLDAGTGATSLVASRVPGSDAYDFEQLRTQAQGTAFLTAIGEMRGTGAISNVEGEAATQAVGRMRAAQSKGAFLDALDDYERVVRKGVANTYRQAGLEMPREAGGRAATAAEATPERTPGAASPSAAPAAPEGLSDGMVIKNTRTNQVMRVQGGRLVPVETPAAPGPAASPAQGAAGASGQMGAVPQFEGRNPRDPSAFSRDRQTLLASPSPAAMEAFNAIWGEGMAERAIRRAAPGRTPDQPYYGRGSYRLQGQ